MGTFDPKATNEIRATAVAPLGAAGFNPPSLLSLFAFPQTFFHNGSADTLDTVMQNVPHRSAGTKGVDGLQSATQRQQLVKFLLSIDGATPAIAPVAPSTIKNLSAASYAGTTVAPESFVAAFGSGLANQALPATSLPLPVVLTGTSVSVLDAAGTLRLAPLFYVSDTQINFLVPTGTVSGQATVVVQAANGATATGTLQVAAVAPGVFSANGNGTGVAAATAIRVAADGTQIPVTVFQCGTTAGSCTSTPIDVTNGGIFVTLYGTGIRNRSSLANVTATMGGVSVPVLFAGPQGGFIGLDQVNIQIPASLKGQGEVNIALTVDGQAANVVTLNVQ